MSYTFAINAATESLIKGYETLRLVAYDDKQPKKALKPGDTVLGKLTIGWGHTEGVAIGDTITKERAQELWLADVQEVIDAMVLHIPEDVLRAMTDNERGAIVSFLFNVGIGWLTTANHGKPATFLTALMNDDLDAPITGLPKFVFSEGQKMDGLIARRAAEVQLYRQVDGRSNQPGGNVVGEGPKKTLVVKVKEFVGGGLLVSGGAGQSIIDTVAQVQPIGEGFPWLKMIFGVAIAVGFALLMYSKLEDRNKSGA